MRTNGARTIGVILSLASAGAAACGDNLHTPAEPAPVFAANPDFTGIWIGVSRVVACENSNGGCAGYPAGRDRYLQFGLTQRGDQVTGSLSPAPGGPTALPPVFWISGPLASGRLSFEPADVAGSSGGLTSFSGEVMLTVASPTEMLGRMTERATHLGQPLTIEWDVRTSRR